MPQLGLCTSDYMWQKMSMNEKLFIYKHVNSVRFFDTDGKLAGEVPIQFYVRAYDQDFYNRFRVLL